MGNCVEKLPHDECGSRRGLQVFEDDKGGYDGYCFSCGTFVPDPYKDFPDGYEPPPAQEITQEDIDSYLEYGYATLADRKLKEDTLRYFGIRVGVDEGDGITPSSLHFPCYKGDSLVGWQHKVIKNKRFWTTLLEKDCDLMGWQQAVETGSKRLFITEGYLDAAALFQCITGRQKGTDFEENTPAVVSIPFGVKSAKEAIQRQLPDIRKFFQEVVLVFDNDDPGKKAVEEVLQIAPKFLSVDLPCKDPNECLIKGRGKALFNACMFKAQTHKNTRVVSVKDLFDKARQPAQWGASYPWEGLTDLTRGIRGGETIYIGSGVKMGKSELLNALAAHCIIEHNWKVFMAKPEESNRKSCQMLLGKVAGRIFHDPKIEFDYEAYDKAAEVVDDRAYLVDLYQHMGWETLKADIYHAASLGCKAVFIDPITNLTVGMESGAANTKLQEIAVELSVMAKDLDITIFIFCHLKAPEHGAPHERGGEVFSYQFAGSRAMMRSCNYMIGLEGNKDPELRESERNMRRLVLLEDREFGNTGVVNLMWNKNTSLYSEL